MHAEVLCKIKCFKNPNDSFYYRKDYRETLWHHLGEKSGGFLFLLLIFGYMGLRCLQGLSLVIVSGGCSLGAGHRLLLGRLLLSRSLGSAAQAPWSWPTGLAAREAIPRQVDRKAGVREEERGVCGSRRGVWGLKFSRRRRTNAFHFSIFLSLSHLKCFIFL